MHKTQHNQINLKKIAAIRDWPQAKINMPSSKVGISYLGHAISEKGHWDYMSQVGDPTSEEATFKNVSGFLGASIFGTEMAAAKLATTSPVKCDLSTW